MSVALTFIQLKLSWCNSTIFFSFAGCYGLLQSLTFCMLPSWFSWETLLERKKSRLGKISTTFLTILVIYIFTKIISICLYCYKTTSPWIQTAFKQIWKRYYFAPPLMSCKIWYQTILHLHLLLKIRKSIPVFSCYFKVKTIEVLVSPYSKHLDSRCYPS